MFQKAMDLQIKDYDLAKRESVIAFATYKSLDSDKDLSNRGMFDKSWKENQKRVRYFLNHKKDQAPGKIIRLWDDDEHAFAQVGHDKSTLGNDVLEKLDYGTIVAASFGFVPTKMKDIKGKGKSFLEVEHHEVSVLTHWGAHEESGPVATVKALIKSGINLKSLSDAEQALLISIMTSCMGNLQEAFNVASQLETDSDLYTWIMWFISRHAELVASLRSELKWGMKEKMEKQVTNLTSFIRNSKASDECIEDAQKSLNQLLHKNSDTATTTDSGLVVCKKCGTYSAGVCDAHGNIKCAECDHEITKGRQPEASRSEDALRLKALAFKLQMQLACD